MTASADPSPTPGGAGCFHCGLPIPEGPAFRFEVGGEVRAFCCPGCEAISRMISGAGLDDYYRLRAENPGTARDRKAQDAEAFDDPVLQEAFVRDAAVGREADLLLEGIRCTACVWLVEQVACRVEGVHGVTVNYATRRATIRWDPAATRLSRIFRAIADVGYLAWPYEEKRLARMAGEERRAMLRRLFVAGFGMMQVMMYAVPAYLATEGDMTADIESLMRWAGFLLTLPVITYAAAPIFRGAWRDLGNRVLGMDVPVALGLAVAFAASTAATVAGTGTVYFDSVAMFVFLLTLGRGLELIAREKAGEALHHLARLVPRTANRLREGRGMETDGIAASRLVPGDRVLVKPGETLPADGELASATAVVSEALLSGESHPVQHGLGDDLPGGSINEGSAFILRVKRVGADTTLAAIHRLVERALTERPRWVDLAQRASGVFVAAILACAVAAFVAWLSIDPSRALWVAVSVLIVTCPCALSLATPVAVTVATGELARRGLVVSRGHAVEALASATDVVFDKTGTLTQGHPRLIETRPLGPFSTRECLVLAAAIAQGSAHPLDRAILEAAGTRKLPFPESHASVAGEGAEAVIDGRTLRIGRAEWVARIHRQPRPSPPEGFSDTLVWLGDTQGWIAVLRLGDAVRPEARAVVQALHRSGRTVHLLTGDGRAVADRVAHELGIDFVEANATPDHKLAYVRALQLDGARVAMVGDGINDAPVLARADVSVAMGRGADVAQVQADAVLVSESLETLAAGFELARRTRRVIRQNLAWALAYNLVVIPLAFAGMVTPLIAGIGMSSSSLVVVANALRLRR